MSILFLFFFNNFFLFNFIDLNLWTLGKLSSLFISKGSFLTFIITLIIIKITMRSQIFETVLHFIQLLYEINSFILLLVVLLRTINNQIFKYEILLTLNLRCLIYLISIELKVRLIKRWIFREFILNILFFFINEIRW